MTRPTQVGGVPVLWFSALASTNAHALAGLGQKSPGQLWIVADRQSAGRGRRGRAWISEPGNLYATRLMVDPAPARSVPEICFVAALALHDAVLDACAELAPARLKLKWPNDLLLDGAKLAGILVEGISVPSGTPAVAIGFGVNCCVHPGELGRAATNLLAAGFMVGPAKLLEALGATFERRAAEWGRGSNFAAIRAAWLARASGLGSEIEVRLADRTLDGTFEAIDESGCLVLRRSDGGRETIRAGDVFPLAGG
jgi:BirA family biotin operon repressor/biotin-[acetyl-CoA-carboxylase] ligase